jgi:hypothetical protein
MLMWYQIAAVVVVVVEHAANKGKEKKLFHSFMKK